MSSALHTRPLDVFGCTHTTSRRLRVYVHLVAAVRPPPHNVLTVCTPPDDVFGCMYTSSRRFRLYVHPVFQCVFFATAKTFSFFFLSYHLSVVVYSSAAAAVCWYCPSHFPLLSLPLQLLQLSCRYDLLLLNLLLLLLLRRPCRQSLLLLLLERQKIRTAGN